MDVSRDGKKLLIQTSSQARDSHIVYKLEDGSFLSLDSLDGVSSYSYILEDEVLLLNSSSQHKSRILNYDLNTGEFKRVLLELSGSIPASGARDVRFIGARDGKVQGWLRIPLEMDHFQQLSAYQEVLAVHIVVMNPTCFLTMVLQN